MSPTILYKKARSSLLACDIVHLVFFQNFRLTLDGATAVNSFNVKRFSSRNFLLDRNTNWYVQQNFSLFVRAQEVKNLAAVHAF